jgi:hypothetical protein
MSKLHLYTSIDDKAILQIISEGNGIEYNLFNDMSAQKITRTQARMLDLVQNGTAPNKHLSMTLGITPKYVKDFFDYFFSKNLITRFPIFSNIGLNSKVWITLIGSQNNTNENLIQNIVEHLKLFLFCCLFYNERSLDQKGRLMLTGILWIPESWFIDFYSVWVHLIDEGFIPKININQGVIKWGLDVADTYDFSIFE